ncbi:MAG: metal ABC transporter ATP-binding protein [Lachnospiraceae bacterium]
MSMIQCHNLVLGYEGHEVSREISFHVQAGDYLCIVGENGAGKSTLMKTLLHLLPPISGDILFGDGLQAYEIGYLPQQSDIQKDFPASVWEIVLSGCLHQCGWRPFYSSKEKELAKENMKKLDIWSLRKKCYRELSGGQQQRVLLARALCATSRLLLLDEPVAGLDPLASQEFYDLMEELHQSGITIIMVSHDMQAALSYASHILHVGRKQLFFGTKEEYLMSDIGRDFSQNLWEGE